MEKHEIALIKIEQAFAQITARFDQKMHKLMEAEERHLAVLLLDRKRKRAQRRKELLAEGKPIPAILLEEDIKGKPLKIPEAVVEAYEQSAILSRVSNIQNLKAVINAYITFLETLKISPHLVLFDLGYELTPKCQKLISLIHIHRAHPDDTIKRANLILNPK
jgi:nitrate reductase NapAB chaperone NapD